MGWPLPGGWGELQFLDAESTVVLRLRLEDWVPESNRLAIRPVGGEPLLMRSGAAALLKKAGVPVTVSQGATVTGGQWLRLPNALPAWYWASRGIAVVVWVVALFAGLNDGQRWMWITNGRASGGYVVLGPGQPGTACQGASQDTPVLGAGTAPSRVCCPGWVRLVDHLGADVGRSVDEGGRRISSAWRAGE
ncbi:hypothetical protein GCM10010361_63920 [Streptomyces olivaceiscleroticus]|uniref:Uncharacterized protein n=1 Tax=Streptomyces olivaceiscleroticus TaxID=68245 RepID=A0ABN1B4D4_9ACTN